MIKNADELKFRCSSLGFLMTYPEKKELPKGAITHAIDRFVSYRYGRHHDIFSRYITKGLMVEEDAITMYSRKHQQMFKKNEEIISNEFISGCPDFYEGESIKKADIITDIKSSWDIFTFFRTKVPDSLKMLYYWQLQGYMGLTGAKEAILTYILVDTPEMLILDEKRKLQWKMGVIDSEANAEYQKACEEIDRLSIYDDIPLQEKIIEINIPRNEKDIAKIYSRVLDARAWLNVNICNTL